MRKNLFAYTTLDLYPAFISINELENGSVEISLRSEAKNGIYGPQAFISLTPEQFKNLRDGVNKEK